MALDGHGDGFRACIERLFEDSETAVHAFVERLDLGVERTVEVSDPGLQRGLEQAEALIQCGDDLSSI